MSDPLQGPLIAYDPRCTGPIPERLTPFKAFVHSGVLLTPELARELERRMPVERFVSWPRVRELAAAMVDPDRPWQFNPEHHVVFDQRGRVMCGRHLVLAVINADRAITLDVWHNASDEFVQIESRGRRRPPADVLGVRRLSREDALRVLDAYRSPHDAATTHFLAERIWDGKWSADGVPMPGKEEQE